MIDQNIIRDLEKHKNKTHTPFWSILIAVVSLLNGMFITRFDGYLIAHSEPYIKYIPEQALGVTLIILGLVKLIAVLIKNKHMRKYSIWGLSAVWTSLFFITLTYSFGTGYPDPSWIFYGMVTVSCYRVSFKGDFNN